MSEWLTPAQAVRRAREAGASVSDSGIRHWAKTGQIASRSDAGRQWVDPTEVVEYATRFGRVVRSRRPLPAGRLDTEARQTEVARLYESGLTSYEVADQLGFSQATVAKDIKKLGISRPTYRAPRKHEQPAERKCRRPDCHIFFTPSASAVAMGHGEYCSRPCAASDKARPRKAGSTRTCVRRGCERRFWVWDAHARRGGKKFGGYCSSECAGRDKWIANEGAGAEGLLRSLESRGLWSGRATQRWRGRQHGYKGAAAGIEAGRARGGRRPELSSEEHELVIRFKSRGLSHRDVAREIWGDNVRKDAVARVWKRHVSELRRRAEN